MAIEISDKFPKFNKKIINVIGENLLMSDLKYHLLATFGGDVEVIF